MCEPQGNATSHTRTYPSQRIEIPTDLAADLTADLPQSSPQIERELASHDAAGFNGFTSQPQVTVCSIANDAPPQLADGGDGIDDIGDVVVHRGQLHLEFARNRADAGAALRQTQQLDTQW